MPYGEKKTGNEKYIFILVYLFILFVILHYVNAANDPSIRNGTVFTTLSIALDNIPSAPLNLKYAIHHLDDFVKITAGVTILLLFGLLYYYTDKQAKETADEKTAKGSAEWNQDYRGFRKKYTIPYVKGQSDVPDNNLILAENLYYGLKEGDNVNVTIIGGAGSGKSFGVIKPNILQKNCSIVVTDPSGEIFRALGKCLMEDGYNVKIFSTSDMEHSNCYNPFDYVYDESGNVDETRVLSMVSMFLKNASETKSKGGDPFWEKSSKALMLACSMYLIEFCAVNERNMYNLLKLVQAGKVNEDSSSSSTVLDEMFERQRKIKPDAHCFTSYDTFKLAPAKTANSILISAAVDLNFFSQTKVRNMTTTAYKVKKRNKRGEIISYKMERGQYIRTDDNIDLRTMGDEKTAMFVNIPQADGTFNFLVSMMYSQLFDTLYGRAEKLCPSRYMAIDNAGQPIIAMQQGNFKLTSEEDVKRVIDLYQNAEVVSEKNDDGDDVYYIKNPNATKEFSIPGEKAGYLKKVYSKEVGEKILRKFNNCSIKKGRGRLPWHVNCMLDEFSNIGEIPEFPQKLATMRKYEISCMIVLQSISQLKERYDKLYSDILSNCNCTIFLGSSDPDTCKYISERLGKKTQRNQSHNVGKKSGGGGSITVDSRELLSQDEVSKIDKKKCIVLVNGEQPFFANKYRCNEHPNWKLSGDCTKEMNLNINEFITCSEKATGQMDSRDSKEEVAKAAMAGKTPSGEKIIKKSSEISDTDALKAFFGVKTSSSDAIAKEIKPCFQSKTQSNAQKIDNKTGKMIKRPIEEWYVGEDLPNDPIELGFPTTA